MTDVSVTQLQGPRALTEALRQFARWWINELRECSPKVFIQSRAETRLFILRDNDVVAGHLVTPSGVHERRFQANCPICSQIDDWLSDD